MSVVKGLVMLDGPDGTGKTTLAKVLCERYGGRYFHMTYRYKKYQWLYHVAMIRHALSRAEHQLVVVDRGWLSEMVYAKVFRGKSDVGQMGRFIDRVLLKHAAVQVLCMDRNREVYLERFKRLTETREEMYSTMGDVYVAYHDAWEGDNNDYDEVDRAYSPGSDYLSDLANGPGFGARRDTLRYAIDDGVSVEASADAIIEHLVEWRAQQYRPALSHDHQNMLGNVASAKYVFVGDRPSTTKHRAVSWPFFYYGKSSLYITRALSKLQFKEEEGIWINYSGERAKETLAGILGINPGLRVIVMGATTAVVMHRDGFKTPFITMFHPGYYQRFFSHNSRIVADLKVALS